jgi:glutamate/tyrosine decarboxylase-like PLP-dependent enzyme
MMDLIDLITNKLNWIPPKVLATFEKRLKRIPYVRAQIQKEYDHLFRDARASLKPYRGKFPSFTEMPKTGRDQETILAEMESLRDLEISRWQDGYVSGAVYHGDEAHIRFLNRIYALNSQSNPLHFDIWPSATKFEAEIVSMTANMLGSNTVTPEGSIHGTVSSGGTESILLAMKAYRDWARQEKGIKKPQMILPTTAHVAFDKAAQYFGIKMVKIPLDANYQADVDSVKKAINRNTIVIVGSAPGFPHGVIDPIEELSELALKRGIGFHTDACLGGFVLPWAEKLGYDVPPYDFRLPGVTSISVDTHKFGYAAKGTSVILYRGKELPHYQYFAATEWPGGLYFSPTLAGSRSGALSAACWASLVTIGEEGYLEATQKILDTAEAIKRGIQAIPELNVLGDPMFVIAFASETLDIYRVLDYMTAQHWSLNGLQKPPAVHICLTLRHCQPGTAERFMGDLKSAVTYVLNNPDAKGGMAPVYGMAGTLPMRGLVADMLKQYLDILFET